MKKTIIILLTFITIKVVDASFVEVFPAQLYYTAIKDDIYTSHLTTYYEHDTLNSIFKIPFHAEDYEILSKTNLTPKYRDENNYITLTSDDINMIEKIIYWGGFYQKYGYNLRYYATQILIWRYLYPDYDIYLSTKSGVKLNYIDNEIEDLENLLNNNIKLLENLVLPINEESTININLDNYNFLNKNNVLLTYSDNKLKITPSNYNSSFLLERNKDENISSEFYINNMNQFFIKESDNISFSKTYQLNVVNIEGDEKNLTNPETGRATPIIILIIPFLLLLFIPITIYILFKTSKNKSN